MSDDGLVYHNGVERDKSALHALLKPEPPHHPRPDREQHDRAHCSPRPGAETGELVALSGLLERDLMERETLCLLLNALPGRSARPFGRE